MSRPNDTSNPEEWEDFSWWDGALHKRSSRTRKPRIGHPGACRPAGAPRLQGAAVAITRCGHLSTGSMAVAAFDAWLAPRHLRWCEGSRQMHAPHAWGRGCAEGDFAELRETWRALGRCWRLGMEEGETLLPSTHFLPPWADVDLYEINAPSAWIDRHDALAVGTGGHPVRFSVRNVSEAGARRYLEPLGLVRRGRLVCGVLPEVGERQQLALLRDAWLAALEAYLNAPHPDERRAKR